MMKEPNGKSRDSYRGVQRQVSKVHREVPGAGHRIGEADANDHTGWPIQWELPGEANICAEATT